MQLQGTNKPIFSATDIIVTHYSLMHKMQAADVSAEKRSSSPLEEVQRALPLIL